jgi:purine-binding chemotaxis protein CheW
VSWKVPGGRGGELDLETYDHSPPRGTWKATPQSEHQAGFMKAFCSSDPLVLDRRMAGSDEGYVLFQSGGAAWAIAATAVAEVLPTAAMFRPAGAPSGLAGFMNVGGEPLAVVRLAALMGGQDAVENELYHHIIRLDVRHSATRLGLLVERVMDVDARAERLAPLDAGQSVNDALVGNLVIGERLVPLLDWGRLLLMEEQQRIEDLTAAARARLAELDRPTA